MSYRKDIPPMADDAAVIAELGRKVVILECRNKELEEKVKNLEELLDQALNVKKVESDEEEQLIEAVVRPWPTSQNEATGCTSATVANQAAASATSIPALTAPITSLAVSAPSTSGASPSGSGLMSPSTSYSTAHANASLPSTSGTPPLDRSKALYEAAAAGDAEKVKKFLREGADVNYRERSSRASPLHAAAEEGRAQVVALLIEYGARLNVRNDEGDTPLHLAASWGYTLCVEKLIEAGAHLNIRGADGETPLHLAVDSGRYGCVRALLDAGADAYVENDFGEIPSELTHNYSIRNLF